MRMHELYNPRDEVGECSHKTKLNVVNAFVLLSKGN